MAENRLQWFKTETKEGKSYVFDPLRRRFVALTPEEEVRQKVLYLLVEQLHVPAGLVIMMMGASLFTSCLDDNKDDNDTIEYVVTKGALVINNGNAYNGIEETNNDCLKVEGGTVEAMDHLPDFAEMTAASAL